MAKKSTTIRVHELAKELGVKSKEIIAKCEAEDIPGVTNHMSALAIGLAETIRQWFGDADTSASAAKAAQEAAAGGSVATVAKTVKKSAAKKKARKASPKKKAASKKTTTKTVAAEATSDEPSDAPTVETTVDTASPTTSELTAAAPPADAPPATPTDPDASDPPAEAEMETEPAPETPAVAAAAPDAGDSTSDDDAPASETGGGDGEDDKAEPVMNVPDRPKEVKQLGRRLAAPAKTKLAGPKVIRVEAPDPVPAPRSSSRRTGGAPGIGRGGPRTGRGIGVGGPPPPEEGPGRDARGGRGGSSRRNKRRSASARDEGPRARTTGSGTGAPRNWREQDLIEREQRLQSSRGFIKSARRDKFKRQSSGGKAAVPKQSGGVVKVSEPLTIKELSAATGVKGAEIVKKLFMKGQMVTINSAIDSESAMELMLEHGIELEIEEQKSAEEQIAETFEQREMSDERRRPPVVAILGHVDHGKTSLLDRIRNANVAEGEAGGITQATSAFQVRVKAGEDDKMITFIDTPGHEAFTEMRARGAKVTDVVVLVVAADDGVMPQTIESINHAKAAEAPIIVALNKIDKPEATDANIQRILGELTEHGLNPVEWGGDTEVVRTSAIEGEGVQELLDTIDFQSELLELSADFDGAAEGAVIEAKMAEGRGAVASLLVQQGRLQKGQYVVVGRAYGRVRDIMNDRGQKIDEALPSMPIALSGINEVPDPGDKFFVVKNLRDAEAAATERRAAEREKSLATEKVTLDNIFDKLKESERKELPLIIKADVNGSVETLIATLKKITTEDVAIAIKHSAVGGVNDSDVLLAEASGAIIIGFNVTTSSKSRKLAEQKGVDIRLYDVIYDITDDVTRAAEGLLEPEHKLEVLGHAEVRQVFKVSKVGMIAGCYVTDGVVERNAQIRVTRDGIVIEKDRRLEQLKRFKDDAKDVRAGQECGMKIEGYDDIREGDILECYKTLEVRRTLS